MVNLARTAYEAYCRSSGGVSLVSGQKLPEWENIGQSIRVAWDAAAGAVRDQLLDEDRAGRLDPITLNPSQGRTLAEMGGGEYAVGGLIEPRDVDR